MNFWIFKSDPVQYRIDDRLLDPDPVMIWPVTRYHDRIKKGDTVFVWRAANPRGICAIMTVEACPTLPQPGETPDAYAIPSAAGPEPEHWAKCKIIQRFQTIDISLIKKIDGLELFSFFSAYQGAINYLITRPEGARLLAYIEQNPPEAPVKKAAPAPKPAAKTRVTQPARPDPEKKTKTSAPASGQPSVSLLKCGVCGRYVVSTDTERHIRENHDGLPVEWKKTK